VNKAHKKTIQNLILFLSLFSPHVVLATTGLGSLAPLQTLILALVIFFVWFWIIFIINKTYKKDNEKILKYKKEFVDKPKLSLIDALMIIHFLLAIIFIMIGFIEVKAPYLIHFQYIYFSFAYFLIFSSITFKVRSKAWGIFFTIPTLLAFVVWTIIMQINASHSVSHYYHFIYSNLTIVNISIIFYSIYLCYILLKIQKDYFK
jgi:hypothetical protein